MDPTRTIKRWVMGKGAARLLLFLVMLVAAPALAGLSATSGWPMMGGTAGHTGEALGQIPGAGSVMGVEWSRQLGAAVSTTPAISHGGAYLIIGTTDGRLVWLDIAAGGVINHTVQISTKTPFLNTPLVDHNNDMAYAGNANGRLYAMQRGTANPIWVAPAVGTAPWGPLAAAPIFIGDDILVASMDGCIYKVTAATGAWTRIYGPIGAGIEATPTLGVLKGVGATSPLAADMPTIGLSSAQVVNASLFDPGDELKIGPDAATALAVGYITRVDTATNTLYFSLKTTATFVAGANSAYSTPHQPLYFAATNGRLYAINADEATSHQRWIYPDPPGKLQALPAAPLLTGSQLFFGDRGGSFYNVDGYSGKLVSKLDAVALGIGGNLTSAAGKAANSLLFVGGENGLVAISTLNPAAMSVQRKYTVFSTGVPAQPVVGAASKLLVSTVGGAVYGLNQDADTEMWHWTPARSLALTGSPILSVIGPDRRVLLVTHEGLVISLLDGVANALPTAPKLPKGHWSQFQADATHPGALNAASHGFTAPTDGMTGGEYTGRKLRWVAPTGGNVRASAAVTRISERDRTAVLHDAITAPPAGSLASTTITVDDASAFHVGDPVIIGDDYLGPIASITRTLADPLAPDTLVVTNGPREGHNAGDLVRVSHYRRDVVDGGDTHYYGSPQVGVSKDAAQGTLWYDNSPVYNPRGLVFSLRGVLVPRFTEDDGTLLTSFAAATGGQEVRFGFFENDTVNVMNPTSATELDNPTYLYIYLTDDGHIGVRRKVTPGGDAQALDAVIPGAGTYALANGIEVVLALRPTGTNAARATAYYRLADANGKFPDDFSGFTAIGSYNLPSGLQVVNATPPPAFLYEDLLLPVAPSGLYPFLRGFDNNAVRPGFDVTVKDTQILIGYDPIADTDVVGPGSSYIQVGFPERFLSGDRVEIFHPSNPDLYETFTVGGVTSSYITLAAALKNSYPPGSLLRAGRPGAWAAFTGSDDGYLRALDPETGTAIWTTNANSYLGAVRGTPAVDEGHARVYATGAGGRLFAFAQNGQWLWSYPSVMAPALGPIATAPVLDDEGNIYFGTEGGYIYKVTPDGELATSSADPLKTTSYPVAPDAALSPIVGGLALYRAVAGADPAGLRVIVPTRAGKVYILDGNLDKKLVYPDDIADPDPVVGLISASPVVGADGTIYIGDLNGKVHAFYEDAMGALKSRWQVSAADTTPIQFTTEGPVAAAAATADGVLYLADGAVTADPLLGKRLYAVAGNYAADHAAALKSKQLDGAAGGALTLDAIGNLLVTTEAASVYCFAPLVGDDDPLWQWNTVTTGLMPKAMPLRTAPAPWLGNLVIVGGDDGNIYGIGPRGEAAPANPALSVGTPGGPWPLAHRDPRRTGADAERHASEPGPKEPSLRWYANPGGRLSAAPVVTDRTPDKSTGVVQGTQDGKVIVYDASTGEARWTAALDGEGPVRGAAAVHTDGSVAVGALDGRAYLFNLDGTPRWNTLTANGKLYGGFHAPIRAANGRVAIATADRLDITGTYAAPTGNPNGAAALLAVLTDGDPVTEVTGGGGLEIEYDLGRLATVSRVRIRTANGGELYFFRSGAWSLYGSFNEEAAPRYITVEANRAASKVRWTNRSAAGVAVQAFEVFTTDGPKLTALDTLVDGVPGVIPSNGATTELKPNAVTTIFVQRVKFTTRSKGELHVIGPDDADVTVAKYTLQVAPQTYEVSLNRMVKAVRWVRDPADTNTLDLFELYGAGGGHVYLFDETTGTMVAEYPDLVANPATPELGPVTAAMASDGDTLFLATANAEALALKLTDLSEVWRKPLTGQGMAPVTIAETGGGNAEVVFVTTDGTVRTLDTLGNPIFADAWRIPGATSNAPATTTELSGNKRWAYLINDRGQIYRINLNAAPAPDGSGAMALGELPTGVQSSPVLDSTGLLYVGTEMGALYCLDTNNVYVRRYVLGVPEYAIGIRWTYFPDRSSLTTALFEDAAPGSYALRVNSVAGFRIGDAVQITRPDGSLPQSLGRITDINEPRNRTAFAGVSGMAKNAANDTILDFTDGATVAAVWPEGVVVGGVCYRASDPDVKYYVTAVNKPGRTITLLTSVASASIVEPVEWVFTTTQAPDSWTLQLRTVDLDGDTFSEIAVGDDISVMPWYDATLRAAPTLRRLGKVTKVDLTTHTITLDKPITLLGVTAEATNTASSKVLTTRLTGKATNAAASNTLNFIPLPVGVAAGQTCYLVDDPATVYTVQAVNAATHVVTLTAPVPAAHLTEPGVWAFDALPPGVAVGQKCYITEEPDTVYTVESVGPGATITLTAPMPVAHPLHVEWTFETATRAIPGGSQVFIGSVYGILYVSTRTADWRTAGDTVRAIRGSAAPMRTAPAIGPGQIAYLGADDGLLYAIGPVGPAGFPPQLPVLPQRTDVSPWYSFHRDNQRTGYADRQGPLTRDLRWYHDTGSTLESSPALGYPDDLARLGVLYVGTADERDNRGIPRQRGSLLSLDASSGRLRWRFNDDEAMGKVVSSPAVFVLERQKPDGEIIKDERVVVGTVDVPDFFYSIMTDALRLDDKGFEEFVSIRPPAGQRILAGDTIVGLYVAQPDRFRVGMEVYITNAGTGSNFEVFGTISSITGDLLRLSKAYTALRIHDLASEVHSQKVEEGHVYCVDRTGELRWKYPRDGAQASERIAPVRSSPVVDATGNTYFGTDDGVVYALNIDGELLWKYVVPREGEAEAEMEITSSPTLDKIGSRLFVGVSVPGANRGYVIALDALTADDTSRLLWKRHLYVDVNGNNAYDANEPGPVTASPTIGTIDGTEVLYIGTDDFDNADGLQGALFCLDLATGNNATTPAGAVIPPAIIGPMRSTAAVIPETNTTTYGVVAVAGGGDTIDVTVTASQQIPIATQRVKIRGNNTTLERGLVTVTQQSEDPATKARVYRLELDNPINGAETYASVRTHEQAVIVGTLDDPLTAAQGDGKLYAFTEDLKANLWSFPVGAPIRTSPAISTEVGLVGERVRSYTAYVGSNSFFLNAITFYGTFRILRWEKDMRDRVYASPAVGMRTSEQDWARAIVYQPSRDHYLYAFGDQVGLDEDGEPQDPDGPTDNYIPPEDDTRPESRVPSTVMVQKSVEYKDGDTNWWKFVVTVRNIGRGRVENLVLYDILPAELSYPLVDVPPLIGDPTAIPTTGPLNADEKMHTPINLGTPAQPQWEIMWTKDDDTGFTLEPDMGDPHQTTTEYKRTFVFYSRVRPSQRTYESMGVKMKVTTTPTVMANDTEVVTDVPAKVHMGDSAYLQITKHPVPAESGGNIGVNQVLARGTTWEGTAQKEIAVRKETPVANDWTDTFIVRMYYNGFKGPDLRLASSGDELRAFSPWNYVDHESGGPLAFQLPYTFKTNGMPVGARQMKTFVSPRKGDNYATSGVRLPLIPNVPQYNQTRFPGVPLSPTVMPYAWRITIQQGRTQLNQKIGEWGPELPFMERIEVGRISGEVPAGGLSVRLKTTNLAKGLRVQAMKLRRLLFDNPIEPDVEVYVVDITENVPVAPDVKDLTLTFARALPAKIEDGAILRDEWTADLAVLNPLAVSGLQADAMNLGTEMRPGGTASAATLTVTNASRWDVSSPYSARYRIRVTPIDLRLPGNAFRWNDELENPATNSGYAFGTAPLAGAFWDGFRYDPYKEYHVTMTGAMLDLPEGSALRAGESLRMHVTRRLPMHQPNGGYGTLAENKLTLLNDGVRVFLDTNLDGVYQGGEDLLLEDLNANTLWDNGERVFVDVDNNGLPGRNEPVFMLGDFDVRIFMDMNGNGICEPGEPFYASAATTDAYTTADALPANPLRTTVGVAIQPALRVPSTVLDLGRQPAGALYGLPLRLPIIENPGNAPLTNVKLSTGNTLATSANYATPLLNMLLRAGNAGVKPDLNIGPPVTVASVSLRKVEEMQPLALSHDMPADWTVLKSPADDRRNFGRPFELPLKTGYRQPTGTYLGEATVSAAGGTAGLGVSVRVNERRASQVVPGLSSPPQFDIRSAVPFIPAAYAWTNYLTGIERWPTAAVLPKVAGTDRDDLGMWVASNTPIANAPVMPAQDTDTTLWYRRVKHLITDLTGVDLVNSRIAIPVADWNNVRRRSDATGDLVILRKKPTVDDPNPNIVWFGQAVAPAVGPAVPGVIDVTPALAWGIPNDQTVVEILAHPWVPVFTQAEMDGMRALLADPGNPGYTPKPIECTTPSVTMAWYNAAAQRMELREDAQASPWLIWSVSALRRVTRNGQPSFLPGSYLAYKQFDPDNPTGGKYYWITPPDMALLGGSLPKVTVREKPTLLPLSWVKAGTPPINGMALYEGSAPSEARKLYYAFAGAQAEEVVTTVGAASVGVALEVASTANLTAGMVIRIDNPAPQPDSFARIATIVDATNVTLQQAVNAAAGAPVLVTNILAVAGAVNPAAATIPVDSTAALYQGQTIVIDNPNSADAIVTVTGVQAGTITVDTPVRVEANAYLRSYWTTDVPFVALNHAFDAVGAVKVFADSVNGTTEATPRNLNLIFQGTVGGNTDLYYARVKVDPRPATDTRSTRPLVLQPLILSDAPDQATGVITEALAPNSMTKPMFFTGGRYRAWWLRVAADARQLKLTVKTKGGTTDTVTMDAWMDKPAAWPADGELVDVFGALDPIREYPLEYTSLNGRLYRIGFNPYTGTARILRQPATDPETVSTVSITGVPRVQRLTNHYAPDVQPIVSVERWRTWDGAPDYGPGSSLQAAPRVWLYWTRQHDDALGSRVYYRTWRMVNAGTAANPIITRLDTEARSETNPQNMDMPERMLPMEVLSPDGTATVVRQSAGVTSPEAGLWVLTTASRDLWPLYPNAGEREMTRHDLFLQVINVPAPDR